MEYLIFNILIPLCIGATIGHLTLNYLDKRNK